MLLGHSKLESTVQYLGIEVDDALILLLAVSSVSLLLIFLPGIVLLMPNWLFGP